MPFPEDAHTASCATPRVSRVRVCPVVRARTCATLTDSSFCSPSLHRRRGTGGPGAKASESPAAAAVTSLLVAAAASPSSGTNRGGGAGRRGGSAQGSRPVPAERHFRRASRRRQRSQAAAGRGVGRSCLLHLCLCSRRCSGQRQPARRGERNRTGRGGAARRACAQVARFLEASPSPHEALRPRAGVWP